MDLLDQLTLAEIEELETFSGVNIDEIKDSPKGKIWQALTFIWGRRTNPSLTMAEVKAMTRAEADKLLESVTNPK